MHFSPIAIGVTALFILARLAAASSDHVDVAAAPLPNHGQLKPAHSRFVPHHRGENSLASHYHRHKLTDEYYSSKEKRQWSGAGNVAAAHRKAQENALRAKLHQLETPQRRPTTYRAVDNRAKALFGRSAYRVNAGAVMAAKQQNTVLQKQIDNIRVQQNMINQRIPKGGRRVVQQYEMSESGNPRVISALGG